MKPSQVPQDPAKARALFLRLRFADNGGVPFCPRCRSEVLREHLTGTIGRSTIRETLLAVGWHHERGIDGAGVFANRESAEDNLTDWLLENALVGFKQSAHIRDYERDILAFTASPLNVMRHAQTNYSRWLKSLRKEFRDRVTANWEPPVNETNYRPRR